MVSVWFMVIAFFVSTGLGQMVSPEVHLLDPVQPGLYLTTAGYDSHVIRPLGLNEALCLKDYPTGVSIRCVGESPYASFYVNHSPGLRVSTSPFYINGNIGGTNVRPWVPPSSVNWVECKLRQNIVYKSRISNVDC